MKPLRLKLVKSNKCTSDLYEFLHASPKCIGRLIICVKTKESLHSGSTAENKSVLFA